MIWTLLRVVIWLPLWLLGLVLFVLGLGLSPWGTALVLDQGQKRGWFSYESVEGALLDQFQLRGLHLETAGANLDLARLEIAWAEDCLLRGRLCLDELTVSGLDVTLSAGEAAEDTPPAEGSGGMPVIHLPFPIELRSLSLDDIAVRLDDGTQIKWDSFNSGATAQASELELYATRLSGLQVLLPLSPGAILALPSTDGSDSPCYLTAAAIDAAIEIQSPLPLPVQVVAEQEAGALPLEARERIVLPEVSLPLSVTVPSIEIVDTQITGAFEYQIERLTLALRGEEHTVELSSLELSTADADLSLVAQVELRDDYPLEGRLSGELHLPEIMPELAGERFTLDLAGTLAALDAQLETAGQIETLLSAHADVLAPSIPFNLTARAERLEWPLPAMPERQGDDVPPPYALNALTLQLEGSLVGYQAALSVNVEGPALPNTRVALRGEGDLERFLWTPLSVNIEPAGSLISHGTVSWIDGLAVNSRLLLNDLAPEAFTDAVEGRLSGNAELAFSQALDDWQLNIPELTIQGVLQELPLTLNAKLDGNSDMQWNIESLDFRQGDNRLTAQGSIDRQLALQGVLDAPDLASLSPELGGSLHANVDLGGTLEAPQLHLELEGDGLTAADNRLAQLTLNAQVSGLDDPAIDAVLAIERLNAAGQRFSTITLNLEGRLSEHRLDLEAIAGRGMPISWAALTLDGGMNQARNRYQGQLTPLEVVSEYGEIRLGEAVVFIADLDAASVQAQPFCLLYDRGGRLCLEETLTASAEQGQAALTIRELPMALLEPFMPEEWAINGQTEAALIARWANGGSQWELALDLASDVALSGLDAYGQPWKLPPSQLQLDVAATQALAEAQLNLSLSDAGDVRLSLEIEDPASQGAVNGRLQLEEIRLSPYQTLVADLPTLEGMLTGDVAIGGDLATPSLDGEIRLDGLEVRGGSVPVEVSDGQFEVILTGDSADIHGRIIAEQGYLEIDGDASWPTLEEWEASINLDGRDDPLLVELPDIGRLRVAPNLAIEVDPEQLQVRGLVEVPWARLEIGQMPASAVTPSSDEIIISERDERRARREAERAAAQAEEGVDESAAQTLAEAGMQLDVQLDLSLGPDMQLEAYGLESGLRGSLEVRQQTGPVQLFGDVNLIDGRFRAFGQDLLIRRGQLLFSGPADQPLLDFEAIRNPNVTQDEVIAGLRVTGAVEAPDLQIFSEPSMDEARALSYLLRGRAPEDGDADGALTAALISMSLSQTGGAVGQIGQAFGIDDLALDTAGAGEDSQVVVSGHLTDDLQISYGVGIFSPIAELTLRYTLWRNLYVQAVSGIAQAVDLVYSFSLGRAEDSP